MLSRRAQIDKLERRHSISHPPILKSQTSPLTHRLDILLDHTTSRTPGRSARSRRDRSSRRLTPTATATSQSVPRTRDASSDTMVRRVAHLVCDGLLSPPTGFVGECVLG